jgi:hypothetical protein
MVFANAIFRATPFEVRREHPDSFREMSRGANRHRRAVRDQPFGVGSWKRQHIAFPV